MKCVVRITKLVDPNKHPFNRKMVGFEWLHDEEEKKLVPNQIHYTQTWRNRRDRSDGRLDYAYHYEFFMRLKDLKS